MDCVTWTLFSMIASISIGASTWERFQMGLEATFSAGCPELRKNDSIFPRWIGSFGSSPHGFGMFFRAVLVSFLSRLLRRRSSRVFFLSLNSASRIEPFWIRFVSYLRSSHQFFLIWFRIVIVCALGDRHLSFRRIRNYFITLVLSFWDRSSDRSLYYYQWLLPTLTITTRLSTWLSQGAQHHHSPSHYT